MSYLPKKNQTKKTQTNTRTQIDHYWKNKIEKLLLDRYGEWISKDTDNEFDAVICEFGNIMRFTEWIKNQEDVAQMGNFHWTCY